MKAIITISGNNGWGPMIKIELPTDWLKLFWESVGLKVAGHTLCGSWGAPSACETYRMIVESPLTIAWAGSLANSWIAEVELAKRALETTIDKIIEIEL